MKTLTFNNPDPATGSPGTLVTTDWFQNVNDEIALVITDAGITLSATDHTQLNQALQKVYAPLNSPNLTGTPTTTTPPDGDDSQKICNTAWVNSVITAGKLGYTPVRQGGVADQGTNTVYIGWATDGSGLLATVDSNDLGAFAFESWVEGNYLNLAGGNITGTLTLQGASVATVNTVNDAETDVKNWANTQYLPLVGGTLTGALVINNETSPTQNTLDLQVTSGANGRNSQLGFHATFGGSNSDTGERLTSMIDSTFNGGAWGTEQLRFWVNNGSSNDTATSANMDEILVLGSNYATLNGTLYGETVNCSYLKATASSSSATAIYATNGIVNFGSSGCTVWVPTMGATDNGISAASTAWANRVCPVGCPQFWPSSTPPSGWLVLNGASFSTSAYPQLAALFPSGVLPDMRGRFFRGWDNGAGHDPDSGRGILSVQSDALQEMSGSFYSNVAAFKNGTATGVFNTGSFSNGNIPSSSNTSGDVHEINFNAAAVARTASETRPVNMAWNVIIRAA